VSCHVLRCDGSLLDSCDVGGMSSWEILQHRNALETEENLLAESAACPSLGDEDVACGLQDMWDLATETIRDNETSNT